MDNSQPSCSSSTSSNGAQNGEMKKLSVLCLHGYRQNAKTFNSKTGSFRKCVKKYADFVYTTAPHKAPPLNEAEGGSQEGGDDDGEGQRSWWFNKSDGTFKGTNQDGPAYGFEESLKHVEKVWREEGPFQGLLGFSQGACFAGLICLLSAKSMTSIKPQFVILAAGFKSGSLSHKNIYEETPTIPSLHIFGESDNIIPGPMSEALAQHFSDPLILTHPGGHFLPASAPQKEVYVNFFQDQLEEYLENETLKEAEENEASEVQSK